MTFQESPACHVPEDNDVLTEDPKSLTQCWMELSDTSQTPDATKLRKCVMALLLKHHPDKLQERWPPYAALRARRLTACLALSNAVRQMSQTPAFLGITPQEARDVFLLVARKYTSRVRDHNGNYNLFFRGGVAELVRRLQPGHLKRALEALLLDKTPLTEKRVLDVFGQTNPAIQVTTTHIFPRRRPVATASLALLLAITTAGITRRVLSRRS